MKILLCYCSQLLPNTPYGYSGLFYLAAALKKSGYEPYVWHGEPEKVCTYFRKLQPVAVCFSCDYDNVQLTISLCLEIRNISNVPIVVGGPQSIALGKDFLIKSGATAILRGEGEYTLPRLLDCVVQNIGKLEKINGAVFLKDNELVESPIAQLIENLDDLPWPAWNCSLHKNRDYGNIIFTGRGCPYRCAYCAPNLGRKKVRLRSIDNVLAEIKDSISRLPNMRYLIIMDDTFTISKKRIQQFCSGMREIRKYRDIVWYCECHIGGIERFKDILPEMIDAGLYRLQIGIESGDQRVLNLYNKHVHVEQIEEFVHMAVQMGLPQIASNFIVGGPVEDSQATPNLIKRLLNSAPGVIDIMTGFLRAYPQTEIREIPEKFGLELLNPQGKFAGNDMPFVVPIGQKQMDIILLRQSYEHLIQKTMHELITAHLVPIEAIMRQFHATYHYNMKSRWFQELETMPRAYEYYYMHYLGEGDSNSYSLDSVLPQRTFEFWRSVSNSENYPILDGYPISPLEYEFLLQCSGKKTLRQILCCLYKKFGIKYSNLKEFEEQMMSFIQTFRARFWITMFDPIQILSNSSADTSNILTKFEKSTS